MERLKELARRQQQELERQRRRVDAGRDVPDLEVVMEALETLQGPEVYGDLPQIALLQEQIRQNLKRVEFLLRREVEGGAVVGVAAFKNPLGSSRFPLEVGTPLRSSRRESEASDRLGSDLPGSARRTDHPDKHPTQARAQL